MTQERELQVPARVLPKARVESLRRSAAAALERRKNQPIGDETEDHRLAQIQAELDDLAFAGLITRPCEEAVSLASDDRVVVNWPFAMGPTPQPCGERGEIPVHPIWRPDDVKVGRRESVAARFEAQLGKWAMGVGTASTPPEPVCPSDIGNYILSEGLRRFISCDGGDERQGAIMAPVVYKDGSQARPLPLRSLPLEAALPTDDRPVLRVTLLSVRHMEMDATVDGAWLRNREISLRRPAALTDELVYKQSREQLAKLTRTRPLTLHMFQTGLETAIVGFYRAVADHHLSSAGNAVAVQPYYFEGGDRFAAGTPWGLPSD